MRIYYMFLLFNLHVLLLFTSPHFVDHSCLTYRTCAFQCSQRKESDTPSTPGRHHLLEMPTLRYASRGPI